MAIPNECSIQCVKCGAYNLIYGVILNVDIYCLSCFAKSSDLQNRLNELIKEEKK